MTTIPKALIMAFDSWSEVLWTSFLLWSSSTDPSYHRGASNGNGDTLAYVLCHSVVFPKKSESLNGLCVHSCNWKQFLRARLLKLHVNFLCSRKGMGYEFIWSWYGNLITYWLYHYFYTFQYLNALMWRTDFFGGSCKMLGLKPRTSCLLGSTTELKKSE